MAKIERTGQIVQILRHEDHVKFSDESGWFLVNTEPGRRTGTGVKWIPDSTRFAWVKNFESLKESKTATAKQVLAYINKTHHEPFRPGEKMYRAVMAHPRWELQRVPLLNLNIPDQEYDDVDYYDNPPESDPYGRVMTVEPGHAGEVSQYLIDRNPIVIDADRYIIDGNHRAWAAKYLLNRDYIDAWVPVTQNVSEAFDRPYPLTWEKSEADDSADALAKLPDGSNLSIMFNQDLDDEGEGIYSVEFWRGNSQEITGAGDSQRVFATVLAAIAQFIKKRQPEQLYFSANKDVEPGQKAGSRSNLYTSLVRRYANTLGYEADVSDFAGSTTYKLYRLNENNEDSQQYLYHATYGPLLKSIQARGLGNTTQSQWTDSKPGVVYLARDPEVARSYAETAESVPEEWLDDIVVLRISQADLDPKLLYVDRNVQDNTGDTLEYHAIIPAKLLRRTK